MDFGSIDWEHTRELAITYAMTYGLNLIFAIAIFMIGKRLAKVVVNVAKRMMGKANVDNTLSMFAGNILYGLAMAFIVIASLSQLGVDTTSLAAVLAAAGLAIGLALQGSLSNFASGVLIILFRPFKLGDFVEVAGVSGSVRDISIFTSSLATPDNKLVIVPNGQITTDNITNFTANETRRIDLVIGVGYDDDLKKVKETLGKIVAENELLLKDPEPVIALNELGDSSVNFVVRPWVKTADYWPARFNMMETIKATFDKEGISIPFPQRDLHIIDGNIEAVTKPAKKTAAKSSKKTA